MIPGIYVDYIVVDENQCQNCERVYDPMLAGNVKALIEKYGLDAKSIYEKIKGWLFFRTEIRPINTYCKSKAVLL